MKKYIKKKDGPKKPQKFKNPKNFKGKIIHGNKPIGKQKTVKKKLGFRPQHRG